VVTCCEFEPCSERIRRVGACPFDLYFIFYIPSCGIARPDPHAFLLKKLSQLRGVSKEKEAKDTFEEYCREQRRAARAYAHYMIEFSRVAEKS